MKCWAGWSSRWNQDCPEKYHNLRYVDGTTLMAESKEELKNLLMKVKEESENSGLKLNFKKKIMASGPITSQQIDGEKMETMFLGRKATTNLDTILKSRNITLPSMVSPVKTMVFPVVMYIFESWTIKKSECWITDGFKFCCWRRLLRVP